MDRLWDTFMHRIVTFLDHRASVAHTLYSFNFAILRLMNSYRSSPLFNHPSGLIGLSGHHSDTHNPTVPAYGREGITDDHAGVLGEASDSSQPDGMSLVLCSIMQVSRFVVCPSFWWISRGY
jgi:hypothetical protein